MMMEEMSSIQGPYMLLTQESCTVRLEYEELRINTVNLNENVVP
jgi:hypothetical protein